MKKKNPKGHIDELTLFGPKSRGRKHHSGVVVEDAEVVGEDDEDGAAATARWCKGIVKSAVVGSEDDEIPELFHRWVDDDEEFDAKESRGLDHAKDLLGKLPDDANIPCRSLETESCRRGTVPDGTPTMEPPKVDCRVGVDCKSGT
jgi:hypothetical protein